ASASPVSAMPIATRDSLEVIRASAAATRADARSVGVVAAHSGATSAARAAIGSRSGERDIVQYSLVIMGSASTSSAGFDTALACLLYPPKGQVDSTHSARTGSRWGTGQTDRAGTARSR